MYADAVGKLWRGAEEERREVVVAAVEAAAVRERWKREAEVQVVGKELGGEGREEEWCTGKKAAALHKAFEKLQSAAETKAQDVRIIPKPPDTDGGGVGKFTGDAGGGGVRRLAWAPGVEKRKAWRGARGGNRIRTRLGSTRLVVVRVAGVRRGPKDWMTPVWMEGIGTRRVR